jgi:hypothetical protein
LLLAAVLCACSKQDQESTIVPATVTSAPPAAAAATVSPAQKPPSTIETAVDGITGRTAVKAGRKAQDKIRGVVGDRDADMKEVDSFGR